RGLFRAPDQDRRGPGEPAVPHRPLQVLRGAEIRLPHQSHVGRLLDAGQCPGLGGAAQGDAADRDAQHQPRSPRGARRRAPAQSSHAGRVDPKGHGLQPDRYREIPRDAAQCRVLRRLEAEIRAAGLGRAGEAGRQPELKPMAAGGDGAGLVSASEQAIVAGVGHPGPPARFARLERALTWATEIPAAALVAVEIVVLLIGVISRYVFNAPLTWSDELASTLFLWLAMLGAVI